MKKASVIGLFSIVTALGLGLGARPASALICCSVCDADPRNPACLHGCSPTCVADDEPVAQDNVVYDDVRKVCYAADDQ